MAMLWILNLSDGTHSLLDIADHADLPFTVFSTARKLQQLGLLLLDELRQ
jgi:aminopeptidase-like protein